MPRITWDRVGERRFENGLDRGVLYLPPDMSNLPNSEPYEDGALEGVPWNGLTSVDESSTSEKSEVYYDGRKISEIFTPGSFEGSLSAVTYPDEFVEIEGAHRIRRGLVATDQMPKMFGLSYRTFIGDDSGNENYKIHILWNLTAVPANKTYNSISDDPELVEFEWDLTAIPEEIPGMMPTAHLILDSRDFDPVLLEILENIIYGSPTNLPWLPSIQSLVELLNTWARVYIVDNGDGTWTATENEMMNGRHIHVHPDGTFDISEVNASYIDEGEFEISDTRDIVDSSVIEVYSNPDGTWTLVTEAEGVIQINEDGIFEIHGVETVFAGPDMYRISSTRN